ncbi:MAG: hypothetical protein ACI86H_001271 [bacterium]|jgi:hypothetical protein
MSRKIEGIKSVELKISASGFGVVNWNGSSDESKYNNHLVPKMRTNKISNEKSMYISRNCIRHNLFVDESRSFNQYKLEQTKSELGTAKIQLIVKKALASIVGLVQGYMVTGKGSSSFTRTSPLLVEDFRELRGEQNPAEVGVNSYAVDAEGNKDKNSLFYQHSFGETEYEGYACILIEDLQFIPLGNNFAQPAYPTKLDDKKDIKEIQKVIKEYLQKLGADLDKSKKPDISVGDFERKGSLIPSHEFGLLLNQDAIGLLVQDVIRRFNDLSIVQGKGFMRVDDVKVHYNSGNKAMVVKRSDNLTESKETKYAEFYQAISKGA